MDKFRTVAPIILMLLTALVVFYAFPVADLAVPFCLP